MASAMMQGLMKAGGKKTPFARDAAPKDKKRVVPLNELPAGDEPQRRTSPRRRLTHLRVRARHGGRRRSTIVVASAKTFWSNPLKNSALNDDNPDEAIKCVVRQTITKEIFLRRAGGRRGDQAAAGVPKEDDSAHRVDEDELDQAALTSPPTADWKIYWDLDRRAYPDRDRTLLDWFRTAYLRNVSRGVHR